MMLCSSPTLFPCIQHSRVSQSVTVNTLMDVIFVPSHPRLSSSSHIRSVFPLCQEYGPTSRGCWWRNMPMRDMEWTYLLGPYSTMILMVSGTPLRRYESKKMRRNYCCNENCALNVLPIAHPAKLQAYLSITNINVVEKLESIRQRGAMSSLVCVTTGMPVGWRPSPHTTLWSWPAAWTSGSPQTRALAHSAAPPSYCRTDPAMPRPAEWEPSCL